jgi:hypothetical protein
MDFLVTVLLEMACASPYCIAGLTQYTYIVAKYKICLYSLRNRPEKLAEGSLFCLFLKLVQINFIFTDNVRILYMYCMPKGHFFLFENPYM